jgi:carbamoyltransferase
LHILGIHDGHNASAALLEDGMLTWAIQEERMVNRKNEPGIPYKAIEHIVKNTVQENFDEVVLATHFIHQADWYREQNFWEKGRKDYYLNKLTWPFKKRFDSYFVHRLRDRKREVGRYLEFLGMPGWDETNIKNVEHHQAHAASAYYGSGYEAHDEVMVFTADGSGDGLSATVSFAFDGEMQRLTASTRDESIGEIYSLTTHYLGFRAWEHEYKLMGMAPYSRIDEEILKGLNHLIYPRQGKFHARMSADFAYNYLKKLYYRKRFDNICTTIQYWFEQQMKDWIISAFDKFLRPKQLPIKVACAGGDYMNVKANWHVASLPEVEDIFITPSAGDESTSIGAAMQVYADYCIERGMNPMQEIAPFGPLYLGPHAKPELIENALVTQETTNWQVHREDNVEKYVAQLLEEDKIVARCSGRCEFGARALGNRTIMANAQNPDNITQLNKRIKHRDFWMPFTPSVLFEERRRLVENPKDIAANYMIMAFPSLPDGQVELKAAMHPYDRTIRPQQVQREWNPGYWETLRQWHRATGCGGFLNTSFNLHGSPIVKNSRLALHTMKYSDLEYLVVDNYVVQKTE